MAAATSAATSALASMLGDRTITPASVLSDLGADSITLVAWADHVEEQVTRSLGVAIYVPDDLLARARTVADLSAGLADLLADRVNATLNRTVSR